VETRGEEVGREKREMMGEQERREEERGRELVDVDV
jgi:hypothetical protein